MIVFSGVTKSYDGSFALEHIDLRFATGNTTVLIGPSGCGKSTILRLINGLIKPTHGVITINDIRVDAGSLLNLRQRMGYMIQDGGLFPHLSAWENISLLAFYLKKPADRVKSRINELCELTHFDTSLLHKFPSQLSGGQRQRVSLMRALMLDPEVLLFDEPLAALDPIVRSALQEQLKHIFSELKKTVILVTHDLHEAAYFADTIVLMNNGVVEQTGTLDELRSDPKSDFVSAFIAAQRNRVIL